MPFNFLLWNCLIPGATSVSESGVSANLKRESDESVLAFRIDTDGFRKRFKLSNGAKVCDALFFYKVKKSDPLLIFVELKGRDIPRAIQQLEQTLSTFRRELEQRGELARRRVKCVAVVVTRRGVHRQTKRLQREFSQRDVPLKFSKTGDLRQLL